MPDTTLITIVPASSNEQWVMKSFADGRIVLPGMQGHRMPPVEFFGYEVPGLPGVQPAGSRIGPRDLSFPLHWWASSRAALLTMRRRFDAQLFADARALQANPRAPMTQIILTEPGSPGRVIRGVYVGGAEGDEGVTAAGTNWETFAITLRCPRPYWSGLNAVTRSWSGPTGTATPFFPLLPVTLSASMVANTTTAVAVEGDIETYPVWTITGPCTVVQATGTTGRWRMEFALPAGRTVTIDTTPGSPSAVADDGTNMWPYLINADMWPLPSGTSNVNVVIQGGNASSKVQVSYVPQWVTE